MLCSFLGAVDKLGTAYIDPVIATGYGAYIATPLLAKAYDTNPEMSETEAAELIHKCMEVLWLRDGRSSPKVNNEYIFLFSIFNSKSKACLI